jgi:hypothetical protein
MERLASPDELDQVLRVTSLPGWVALAAFCAALMTLLIWTVTGTVSVTVSGHGVLIREGGVNRIVSLWDGVIAHVPVKVGDVVRAGDVVATLQTTDGRTMNVASQVDGTVLEVPVEPGAFVHAGEGVARTEAANANLIAVLYVPAADGERVKPGMRVQLLPATVRSEEDGFMEAVVRSVSRFPATDHRMTELLGAPDLIQSLKASGPVVEVTLSLKADQNTPSGYQWSAPPGPSLSIDSGTLCTGKIVLRKATPAGLATPARG